MPPKKQKHYMIHLDKVERKKLAEIRLKMPEYADMSLTQIAHVEFKTRLFDRVKELNEPVFNFAEYAKESKLIALLSKIQEAKKHMPG